MLEMSYSLKRTYFLLHRIERKYGSIAYCPITDSNYRKLRRLYPERSTTRERTISRILDYGIAGFPPSYICKRVHMSSSEISMVLTSHGIPAGPTFHYRIITPDLHSYYVGGLVKFVQFISHRSLKTVTDAKILLTERDWDPTYGTWYWHDVRLGDYYWGGSMRAPAMKTDEALYTRAKSA